MRDILCASPVTTVEKRACAHGYIAADNANACVDDTIADADKCTKVCKWLGQKRPPGESITETKSNQGYGGAIAPQTAIERFILRLLFPMVVVISVLFAWRLFHIIIQILAVHRNLKKNNMGYNDSDEDEHHESP